VTWQRIVDLVLGYFFVTAGLVLLVGSLRYAGLPGGLTDWHAIPAALPAAIVTLIVGVRLARGTVARGRLRWTTAVTFMSVAGPFLFYLGYVTQVATPFWVAGGGLVLYSIEYALDGLPADRQPAQRQYPYEHDKSEE
jgi:uncharacterized membrane protein